MNEARKNAMAISALKAEVESLQQRLNLEKYKSQYLKNMLMKIAQAAYDGATKRTLSDFVSKAKRTYRLRRIPK